MMTWEELMGMTSAAGYDICSEDVTETSNYPTSTNGRRYFKPQTNYPTSTTEEETERDPSELIYDLPEYFMMTWEELMGMTSAAGYDICSEDVTETSNYPTSTNGRRYFKPQTNYPTSTNGGETLQTLIKLPSTNI